MSKLFLGKINLSKVDENRIFEGKQGKWIDGTGILANITNGGEFMGFKGKPVICYDRNGSFLKIFDDVKSAAIELGLARDSIYQSMSTNTPLHDKLFRYLTSDYTLFINPVFKDHIKPVYQYSLTGKFIKKWDIGCDEIAKIFKVNRSCIRRSCLGAPNITSVGYIWSYKQIEFIKEINFIGQYTFDGELIEVFENAAKAAKKIGTYNSSILLCCKNKMKSTGGFKWKFIKKED